MSKIRRYVETLTSEERERFADLVEECTAREAAISVSALRAQAALGALQAREDEFWHGVRRLREQAERLRDTIARLYLLSVPPRGQVS